MTRPSAAGSPASWASRSPRWRTFAGRLAQELRYGENPHQQAAFYVSGERRPGVATAAQLQGKELSYNNLNDTDAAFELVAEFDPKAAPAVAIIKHANPCGVAIGATFAEAYAKALRCDPVSAFGGIIALNGPIDAATAREITGIFTEVVIAPTPATEAKAIFAAKKNLRLLTTGGLPDPRAQGLTFRSLAGGFLVQSRDNAVVDDMELKVVTKRQPTPAELADLKFAFKVAKHVKSNAIVYAKDGATVGIGAGQMSRVDSARIAAWKSLEAAKAAGLERAAGQGLGGRLRRLLPVRRRPAGRRRGRRHRRHPARRLDARRRGDRRRRRQGPRHGLHRRPPLPALAASAARFPSPHGERLGVGRGAGGEAAGTCDCDSRRAPHPRPSPRRGERGLRSARNELAPSTSTSISAPRCPRIASACAAGWPIPTCRPGGAMRRARRPRSRWP